MSDLFAAPKKADVRREDVLDELKREIQMRRRVYPRFIAAGKLDAATARWRILILEAAIDYIETIDPES